ncbi:17784_t:CDS:2, partial [Entrophospora sp. SA101]
FLETIHGGIIDEEQKLNTVLQEVMIIKGQIESLENNKPAPPDDNPIKAVQVLPSELEDPMYPKKTDRRGKSPYIVKKTLRKVIEVALVPYGKWDMTKVKKHVLAGGRENIQFGDDVDDETKNLQQEYAEIIKGAWKADPLSRSLLQKIFLELDGLHSKYPPPVAESRLGPSKSIDFDGSLKEGKKPVSISEEDGSIQLNKFPQSSTTMMLDDETFDKRKS